MTLRFAVCLVCDGCGAEIKSNEAHATMVEANESAHRKAARAGWVRDMPFQGRDAGKLLHKCAACQ